MVMREVDLNLFAVVLFQSPMVVVVMMVMMDVVTMIVVVVVVMMMMLFARIVVIIIVLVVAPVAAMAGPVRRIGFGRRREAHGAGDKGRSGNIQQ